MITLVKFTNGVEIIGDVTGQSAKAITITNPVQINYKNIESSIPSVSLTRFMQFAANKQHTFDMKNVLSVAQPIDQMVKYYEVALNHFETEVDDVVRRELARVVADETDATDAYSAILERLSTNRMLN